MRALLLLCILLLASLPGCVIRSESVQRRVAEENLRNAQYYNLVLHPPHLAWDDANQTLSGNVTLSALPPTYPTRDEFYDASHVVISIEYRSTPPEQWPPGLLEEWSHRYDVMDMNKDIFLRAGETVVYKFVNHPHQPLPEKVRGIVFKLYYSYPFTEDLENGFSRGETFLIRYINRCLEVADGELRQSYATPSCRQEPSYPLKDQYVNDYHMEIEWAKVPPVDDWNNWHNIWPPLAPIRDFLNNFTYEHVRYFKGQVYSDGREYTIQ